MIYKFADFKVRADKVSRPARELFEAYAMDTDEFDVKFDITVEDIRREAATYDLKEKNSVLYAYYLHRLFAEWLPMRNAFVLHSACFDVDGVGVAFAAHSGTGKTTHMMLWQQLLGDRMTVVNGDKPIVRFFDNPVGATIGRPQAGNEPTGNHLFAYGTPWNGKEHLGCNMRTPLRHLCFIERAEQNSCEPMTDTSDAIDRLFNQVYMPKDPAAAAKTIQLINRLIGSVRLWKIKCNMDISAAEIAYHTIFG